MFPINNRLYSANNYTYWTQMLSRPTVGKRQKCNQKEVDSKLAESNFGSAFNLLSMYSFYESVYRGYVNA